MTPNEVAESKLARMAVQQRLVSIVMSSYNSESTIVEAIESVLKQTYTRWELLIVDDASYDASWAIVSAMAGQDKRIRCIQLPKNSGGPALPRNVGIEKARGELLAFLDADDHWLPEKLAIQVKSLLVTEAAVSCTAYHVINESNQKMGRFTPPPLGDYSALLKTNSMGCSTVMLDITRIGKRYFPALGHEDYALWLSILREGYSVIGIPELLSVYRLRAGSMSSNKVKVLKYFWRIYRKCERLSVTTSLWYTLRYAYHARNKYQLKRQAAH